MTINATATHFVGYDMSLVNVKAAGGSPTNMYVVKLKFYRDMSGTNIPTSFTFKVFKNSNNQEVTIGGNSFITLNKVNPAGTILMYNPADCPPIGFLQSLEYGLYESAPIDLSSLNDPAGYYLYATMCCRNGGIVNMLGGPGASIQYGATFTMDFPALNPTSPYKYNSSPAFKKHPLAHLCVGKTYTLDWGVTDPDGDSLRFSFAHPLGDNNDTIPFDPGYNLDSLIDGSVSINPATGVVVLHATMQGKYQLVMKCEEYRAGVKIGENRREIQIETVVCNDVAPIINHDSLGLIIDTIYYGQTDYALGFTGYDSVNDSITMEYLQPYGDNLIGQGAQFGLPRGPGLQFKIEDIGMVRGVFQWIPDCSDIRSAPYRFDVVVYDRTCPSPLYDTVSVSLYVEESLFEDTLAPVLNAHGDTFTVAAHNDSLFNYLFSAADSAGHVLSPYLFFSLDSASHALAAYTNFDMLFHDTISTYGQLKVSLNCNLARPEPYIINVHAMDGDECFPDTSSHTIYLFITPCITGVNNSKLSSMSIYPNPASNQLYIDNKNNITIQQLQLLSIEGKEIFKTKNISTDKIDVSDLPEGLYLLRLQTSEGMVQKKVSIVH
jgi:hypothetical protein